MRGIVRATLLVAIGAIALCSPPPPPSSVINSISSELPSLPLDALVGTGVVQSCQLPDVVGRARCGVYRVRERRDTAAAQHGRTLDIAFVVLEAQDSTRRTSDPLIPLPGGPGQSFISSAGAHSRRYGVLRQTHDVLLVDTRGVGRSARLSCDVPLPDGFQSRFGTLFPLNHVDACRSALSARAALDQYTTTAAVQDIEEIRRWLSYAPANLIGVSYGTRVAQVYLRDFPASVRTATLNGVTALALPSYVQSASLLQRALDRLVDECLGDSVCSSDFPALREQLRMLLDRVRDGRRVTVTLRDGTAALGSGDLAYALRGLLYNRGADVPAMIAAAATGPLEPLAQYYVERLGWIDDPTGHAGLHFSVLCAEDITPTADDDVIKYTRGTFVGDHIIASYRAACRRWPHARIPRTYFTPVRSATPVLLLSGSRDPVTPPEAAESVAANLSNRRHVIVPNGGHGVGGACVDGLIAQLVDAASVTNLDASCVRSLPPTRFRRPIVSRPP